jgi:hypothetical protein
MTFKTVIAISKTVRVLTTNLSTAVAIMAPAIAFTAINILTLKYLTIRLRTLWNQTIIGRISWSTFN